LFLVFWFCISLILRVHCTLIQPHEIKPVSRWKFTYKFVRLQSFLPFRTRSSTAVHHRTLARSLTLPTFQVAKDFALPPATASFSFRFTAPLLAAEHFRLLAFRCGTACHRRLRRHRLWRPSSLDSRRSCLLNHILTFGSSDFLCVHTFYIVDLAVF